MRGAFSPQRSQFLPLLKRLRLSRSYHGAATLSDDSGRRRLLQGRRALILHAHQGRNASSS
jgi:hypothetical protein